VDQNLIIGIFALGFGLVTLVVRFVAPSKLGKLEPMKERFGAGVGTAIHVTAYTIAPIVIGGTLLYRSLGQ